LKLRQPEKLGVFSFRGAVARMENIIAFEGGKRQKPEKDSWRKSPSDKGFSHGADRF
jgi:hypothetical protein